MAEKIIALPQSCAARDTPAFLSTLKQELEALDIHSLPLQDALAHSSCVADEAFTVFPRAVNASGDALRVEVDVLYAGLVAGCNCSDDPTVVKSQPEQCRLQLVISIPEACARVSVQG